MIAGLVTDLACPYCSRELVRDKYTVGCTGCKKQWKIDEYGITDFSTDDFWWNQISQDDMMIVLDTANKHGWQSALEYELLPRTSEYVYQYAAMESRADWHFLLELTTEAKVLDIGCGWGAVSTALARHYQEVHAIDSNLLTLRFVKIRTQQEGIANLKLSRTNSLEWTHLPFKENYFDAVILNGVLEWIGAAKTEYSPTEYQRKALIEVRRILKPGGKVYVGIENRIGYGNFLGGRAHNGVPFADILPRWAANWLSFIFGHRNGFRTYTYSLEGYQKLFWYSGFSLEQTYYPYPDYRFPTAIIPMTNDKYLDRFVKTHLAGGKLLAWQLFARLHLVNFMIYSYAMILKKRG